MRNASRRPRVRRLKRAFHHTCRRPRHRGQPSFPAYATVPRAERAILCRRTTDIAFCTRQARSCASALSPPRSLTSKVPVTGCMHSVRRALRAQKRQAYGRGKYTHQLDFLTSREQKQRPGHPRGPMSEIVLCFQRGRVGAECAASKAMASGFLTRRGRRAQTADMRGSSRCVPDSLFETFSSAHEEDASETSTSARGWEAQLVTSLQVTMPRHLCPRSRPRRRATTRCSSVSRTISPKRVRSISFRC